MRFIEYEGTMSIPLKKSVPFSILSPLLDMCEYDDDNSVYKEVSPYILRLKRIKKENNIDFFQKSHLKDIHFEFIFRVKPEWNSEIINMSYDEYCIYTSLLKSGKPITFENYQKEKYIFYKRIFTPIRGKNAVKKCNYRSILLKVSFSSDEYHNEFENLLTYLKDYMYDNMICLGRLEHLQTGEIKEFWEKG